MSIISRAPSNRMARISSQHANVQSRTRDRKFSQMRIMVAKPHIAERLQAAMQHLEKLMTISLSRCRKSYDLVTVA